MSMIESSQVTAHSVQMTSDVGLEVVDLRKSFLSPSESRIEVLRGVTLRIRAGESLAITGASGSGKSTLLHLLGGLETPDHGNVLLDGTDVAGLRGKSLAIFQREQIGFVFQFHYLLTDLTAVENVALPLLISRRNRRSAMQNAAEFLREVGLEDRLEHPVSQLSGGEQQRVAVARALIRRPRLLLADEPTGNLDETMGEEIGKTLINYAQSQAGMVVIATHNHALANICDRTLVLKDGRV